MGSSIETRQGGTIQESSSEDDEDNIERESMKDSRKEERLLEQLHDNADVLQQYPVNTTDDEVDQIDHQQLMQQQTTHEVIPEDAHEDDEMYSSLSSGQRNREEHQQQQLQQQQQYASQASSWNELIFKIKLTKDEYEMFLIEKAKRQPMCVK